MRIDRSRRSRRSIALASLALLGLLAIVGPLARHAHAYPGHEIGHEDAGAFVRTDAGAPTTPDARTNESLCRLCDLGGRAGTSWLAASTPVALPFLEPVSRRAPHDAGDVPTEAAYSRAAPRAPPGLSR